MQKEYREANNVQNINKLSVNTLRDAEGLTDEAKIS